MNSTRFVALAAALFVSAALFAQNKKNPDDAKHDPAQAVANLDVHPELEATLFASEPTITNPVNLDIDHRGRVWVCDVVNYRGNNGKRPEGDRILILEDTDGDGKADKTKTFYQGRDIDSAMGICVLGNKVIVSATPNIFVFTFDADDKVTKKELLFTKTGQPQHDHSAHSFLFGPDGKLYWNFGNTGQKVCDKDGKQVIDLAGNPVVDNGKPYFGGMPFRCDMDGSNFEVLGHNFRNNYEVTVDSFGTLWQSDNDDDGNRGVRINYVMEFGNFGYRDEMTGAGWQTPRTNMETEIPLRHWHLNDPGVVPNLLQTGQGSPCGICVYEGTLLPKVFHGQVIHADAGPSIVRAYPAKKSGAGYTAEIVNILDGAKKNNWFRPADVCVAHDGALFVTDWYDPGVGGHAQRDSDRGRIFRVAPKGNKPKVPTFDFKTAAGAAEAFKSPNLAVRYMAYTALQGMPKDAEPELEKLLKSDDARLRARALWLLGKLPGRGEHYIRVALKDKDPDIRIVGIRLARQLNFDVPAVVKQVAQDPAPEVRREAAIALRQSKTANVPALWAELAWQHDGKDRWYLEALGIAADKRWDACLEAYLSRSDSRQPNTAERDVIWRSRAEQTPKLLASLIQHSETPTAELPRFFRAFDFQAAGEKKEKALLELITGKEAADAVRQNLILSETVKRLKGIDVSKHPALGNALELLVARTSDAPTFIDIVASFGLSKHYPKLLVLARESTDPQVGVNAVKALLDLGQQNLLRQAVDDKDTKAAAATLQALANAADNRAVPLLMPIVSDAKRELEQRRQAVRALAKVRNGANQLLKLASSGKLDPQLKDAAGGALHQMPNNWKEERALIGKLFPLPVGKGDKPLPAIPDLVKLKGDVAKGKAIFADAKGGTCANCHIVNGVGKNVGPDLSEIGKKLSKEAFYESILYPSAGISHSFETWIIETKNGTTESGLLVSDTPQAVTIKNQEGIEKTVKRDDIDSFRKSPTSLMPADIYKQLTAQDLADIVEYLQTLKEATKSPPKK